MKILYLASQMFLVVQVTSCANISVYNGVYTCANRLQVDDKELSELADRIGNEVIPFGFQQKDGYKAADRIYMLSKSHDHIRVSVGIWRSDNREFGVTIKDYDNVSKTEFVRTIEKIVIPHIRDQCKGEINFRRQADLS